MLEVGIPEQIFSMADESSRDTISAGSDIQYLFF
jgi:hypothetical protein